MTANKLRVPVIKHRSFKSVPPGNDTASTDASPGHSPGHKGWAPVKLPGRRSLRELYARAIRELALNPTITSYYFIDGLEYRIHHVWSQLQGDLKRLRDGFAELKDSVQQMMFGLGDPP
jgi:hypothetical protein